jgi:hypothetical protein
MTNKDIEKLLKDMTKSQDSIKGVLETFAFDNKIDLEMKKSLIKDFLEQIRSDDFDVELFKSLLNKMK